MLDGLLSYAVAQETFGARAFTRRPTRNQFIDLPLPLDSILPGVYAASQGFTTMSRRNFTMITQLNDGLLRYNNFNHKATSTRASLQGSMVPFSTLSTPSLTFFGCGDGSAVLALLRRHIKFLGRKRSIGYGHILSIRLTPLDEDLSWSRFHPETGLHFHRPMPLNTPDLLRQLIETRWTASAAEWWEAHQQEWPQERLALSSPYYDPTRQQLCYSPDEYGLIESVDFLPAAIAPTLFPAANDSSVIDESFDIIAADDEELSEDALCD